MFPEQPPRRVAHPKKCIHWTLHVCNVFVGALLLGPGTKPQYQTRFFIPLDEPRNERARRPQQTLDLSGRTVGGAKPDDLGRVPAENASFLKVGVLRDDCEPVVFGILPNDVIVGAAQSAFMHMGRTGINIGQHVGQARRKIFVEEKLHAFEISSLRSRSAAYARQARMSSSER